MIENNFNWLMKRRETEWKKLFIFERVPSVSLGTLVILYSHQTLISMNKETSIDLKKAMEKKHQ